MKLARLFTMALVISAFTTAGFAGSCCSKNKSKDGKAKQEQKDKKKDTSKKS